jgi:hypothetical protein
LKSSDVIIADADKQFVVREFKQYAENMKITIKTIFVETHHSIEISLAVGLGFGQKFKPDPRVDVRSGWTDQSPQPDLRVDVRRVLSSLSETSYI